LEQRRKKTELGFVGRLYTAPGVSLVTTPSEEELPAPRRKEARRRAGLQHTERMRMTFSLYFFDETLRGLVLGRDLGRVEGFCWAAAW
jgi:hypothetical protein